MNLQDQIYNIPSDIIASIISIAVISLAGAYISKLKQLNDEKKLYSISKIVEQLLIPCLIFYSFLNAFQLKEYHLWVPLVFISIQGFIQGCLLGKLMNKFVIKDQQYDQLIMISCGLAKANSIQFNISHNLQDYLELISQDFKLKYNIQTHSKVRASAYIMIYMVINTIIRWSYGKYIIKNLSQNKTLSNINDIELGIIKKNTNNTSQNKKKKFQITKNQIKNINNEEQQQQQQNVIIKPEQKKPQSTLQQLQQKNEHIWFSNVPLIVSCVAILITLIPALRMSFVTSGSFLNRLIYTPSQVLGEISNALIQIIVGSNIYNSYGKASSISRRTVIWVTVTRLIINPIVGAMFLYGLQKFNLIVDPVMIFICQLSYSTPTANNLYVISQLYSDIASEAGMIVMFGAISSAFTLPIVMIFFFYIYI